MDKQHVKGIVDGVKGKAKEAAGHVFHRRLAVSAFAC
jgi:uncharacterized protein YjbJ (UPF0337 family)